MFHLDTLSTLVAATLVLLLGRKLVQSVSLLKKYTIPEPVAGGLLVALALLVLKKSLGWEIDFDMSLKDPLMLAFFATIGLNANIASLRAGGKVVGTFLIVVVGLLLLQNSLGIGMAKLLGLDPIMGCWPGRSRCRRPRYRRGVEQAVYRTLWLYPRNGSCHGLRNLWSCARRPDWRAGRALSGEAFIVAKRYAGRSGSAYRV